MILPLTYRRYGGFYQTVYCCAIGMTGKSYIFPSILKGGNFFPSGSQEKAHHFTGGQNHETY